MFEQLDEAYRKGWWNKVEVTPKYLTWAGFCLLIFGITFGFQLADMLIRRRWSWVGLLLAADWALIAYVFARPVYRVIKHPPEDHNG